MFAAIPRHVPSVIRAIGLTLGALVVGLAMTTMSLGTPGRDVIDSAFNVLGPTFIVLLFALVVTTVFCWIKMATTNNEQAWFEGGMHAAQGVATLALTFTLLGISLGIGSLADNQLTPDTIQSVISQLTNRFSMAFMTTVIGLPVSAVLRTGLAVTYARRSNYRTCDRPNQNHTQEAL